MIIPLSDKSANQIYHLMTQSVIPRPIAWVLTDSASTEDQANYNLAPFSYFTAVSSAPPLLMFSVGKKPTGENKDTVTNVNHGSPMVIHIATGSQFRDVTTSAATLDHGESELDKLDLPLTAFDDFPLPRIASCPIAFGCSLYQTTSIGDAPQTLIFAKIETIFVADELLLPNEAGRIQIDASKVAPLARLGASQYSLMGEIISQARPK